MDLTLFIIILLFFLLIYYLIKTISSLQEEIRDMKKKCIQTYNLSNNDLLNDTPMVYDKIYTNLLETLHNIKNYIK